MNLSGLSRTNPRLAIAALSALAAVFPLNAQTSVTGAGATFPAPIYQKWFADYQSIGNVQINYQPNGSGGGIKAVTDGTADFGASDMPMTDAQIKTFKDKNGGHGILLFPTVLGAVVPVYNVPGVSAELNFPRTVLADIFLGKVTTWNDPALVKANPGVKLPSAKIVVVHRSDGSGTSFCFTDFLSKVSPEWSTKVGRNTSVDWPVGLGAKSNDGVAGLIKQESGSLGYVELIYAVKNKLTYGKVQNKANQYVKGELSTVTAAAASVKAMPADFRVSITDADGKNAYPISTFTWLLIPDHISDSAKKTALTGFLKWAITKGQDEVESLDYAKLPASVVSKEQSQIGLIK
jgi:phosphate transport system substrate-binding protein